VNIPEIFLRELWETWPMACAVAVGSLIGVVIRLASNGGGTFIAPTKSFPELVAFTKDDQRRLLCDACRETFSALSFAPELVVLAFVWGGWALARTLEKVIALPGWAAGFLPVLFGGLGFWLGGRLEAHRVRPFLKKLIEGQNGKTVA
jgi:hypothetical protein